MKIDYIMDHEVLLRDFLKEIDISDKLLADIKNNGDLLVNQQHVTVRCVLKIGDHLSIVFPKEKIGQQLQPEFMPLHIVYEDECLLVIDKPAMIPCIPDHRYHNHTLANGIMYYYQKRKIESTVHFVNRLDRETSGLLIIAKYRFYHYLLSKKHIDRKYLALVEGDFDDQMINLPIHRLDKSVKRVIHVEGKPSITHCHCIKKKEGYSLVECALETGRTHQIRVHLSTVGHPLVGDSLYGGVVNMANTYYLHSYKLSFIHPKTNKTLSFESTRPITIEYYKKP